MSSDDKELLDQWLELDRLTHMRGGMKNPDKQLARLEKMTCPDCKGGKSPQAKKCAACARCGSLGKAKKKSEIDIPKLREILLEHAAKTGFPYQ